MALTKNEARKIADEANNFQTIFLKIEDFILERAKKGLYCVDMVDLSQQIIDKLRSNGFIVEGKGLEHGMKVYSISWLGP